MDKKALREFREKLVKARADSANGGYVWLGSALQAAGFPCDEATTLAKAIEPWYYPDSSPLNTRPAHERKAMWDNSIAAIDAQLARKP